MDTPSQYEFNPFAAPQTGPEVFDPFQQDDARIRQQFIDCEANIASIASLTIFGGGVLTAVFAIGTFLFGVSTAGGRTSDGRLAILCLALATIFLGQLAVGIGLNNRRPWSRIGAIVVCTVWLLFFPLGTIFAAASIWYLVRPAAKYVFTPEYDAIVRRTPGVRFSTSKFSWGLLGLALLGFLAFVAISLM